MISSCYHQHRPFGCVVNCQCCCAAVINSIIIHDWYVLSKPILPRVISHYGSIPPFPLHILSSHSNTCMPFLHTHTMGSLWAICKRFLICFLKGFTMDILTYREAEAVAPHVCSFITRRFFLSLVRIVSISYHIIITSME